MRRLPLLLLLALPARAAETSASSPEDRRPSAPKEGRWADGAEADAEDPIARSVVRIYAFYRRPNSYQPWQMNPQESATGSGCLIAGGRILTNAHVVGDQVYIQVRKAGDPKKYTASVEFVAHDSELAVLKVADPEFHQGTRPIELGGLPRQRDRVATYGFPVGGEDLSVTEGIVSRIEVTDYEHTGQGLLTIQTDAAINPGNSGGPAVKDGKLIGVAFQMADNAQSIGYIVPMPVIARFLEDIEDGRYDGVPDLGISWQTMENEALRRFHGLRRDESGVRVLTRVYGSPAWGSLEPGDVLTSIDGTRIADDGTVPLRRHERVLFYHLVTLGQMGRRMRLGVIRGGKRLEVPVVLKKYDELVKRPRYDLPPSYFVFAGLVFTPLTRDYIDNWDYREVPTHLKFHWEFGLPSPERRELVLLGHVLPHDVNSGYQDYSGIIVERVNGAAVASLRDVISALAKPSGPYHVIEFDRQTDGGMIALAVGEAEKASAEILARYGIPSDRSEDLK